jgi:hypothetical protein
MLLQPGFGDRQKPVCDREDAGLAMAMPAPIDGNGLEAEIDRGEIGAGVDAGVAQDRPRNRTIWNGAVLRLMQKSW